MLARLSLRRPSHLARRLSHRARLNTTMAANPIYLVPVDPTAPQSTANVDAPTLWSSVPSSGKPAKVGTSHLFFSSPAAGDITVLSSLGGDFGNTNKLKGDARREVVRSAVGSAVNKVKTLGEGINGRTVVVDAQDDPHAAAVAAHLALYGFNLKTEPPSRFNPNNKEPIPDKLNFKPVAESTQWDEGVTYAYAQNLARTLTELPANLMTPTIFTERIKSEFTDIPNTEILVRDEAWAAEKGMRTFLSVTQGTSEPAKFLEIHYKGAADKDATPVVLVGKGITFDSGGISIKPGAGMKLMRGDMGGAAAVTSAAWAIAKLQLPVNLVVLTPLCENMPGPSATKPGDVIYAMNGKSVEVDNTDAEGRLILADALWYGSTEFKPKTIIDVATLTGAMDIALGEVFTGVFTNSDELWESLDAAGKREHDRFWRMPLSDDYAPQIERSNADLCNVGGRPAGSCTAALFLKSFVSGVSAEENPTQWAHLDIAGTMEATRPGAYQAAGMTGRGTRALVEWVRGQAA
ncbi:cytosol aminopeptidase family, catalytic domain-containing protein [Cristinia sonorae]|uniref:leucyl aminopeptidase n=1 Tax=Cristinia sonorae TaxID=1940300 RepID=A0A8K0UR60_9AGAR|nr:cytosol aminopeptidase family, catalytic domain-containing protein [Cristinia sonorae]